MAAKITGVLLLAFLLLGGCAIGERHIAGRYTLVSLDPENMAIKDGADAMAVFPNVTFQATDGRSIYGCRRRSSAVVADTEPFNSGFGWFILDVKTGKLIQGLSLEELIKRLPTATSKVSSMSC